MRELVRSPAGWIALAWIVCWTGMIVLVGHHNALCDVLVAVFMCGCALLMVTWCLVLLCEGWLIRMIARVFPGVGGVELIAYDGRRFFSFARRMAGSDNLQAPVYYFAGVGQCILLPQGLNLEASKSSWILFWLPLNKKERMAMILREDMYVLAQLDQLTEAADRARALHKEYNQRLLDLKVADQGRQP
jgi:hypothetical protein